MKDSNIHIPVKTFSCCSKFLQFDMLVGHETLSAYQMYMLLMLFRYICPNIIYSKPIPRMRPLSSAAFPDGTICTNAFPWCFVCPPSLAELFFSPHQRNTNKQIKINMNDDSVSKPEWEESTSRAQVQHNSFTAFFCDQS